MTELYKSKKLCNKILSFYDVNMDFNLVVDNAFLTKIIPYNTKIPEARQKETPNYIYTETPFDQEIKSHKYGLISG